jgi:hypothetical protein
VWKRDTRTIEIVEDGANGPSERMSRVENAYVPSPEMNDGDDASALKIVVAGLAEGLWATQVDGGEEREVSLRAKEGGHEPWLRQEESPIIRAGSFVAM